MYNQVTKDKLNIEEKYKTKKNQCTLVSMVAYT